MNVKNKVLCGISLLSVVTPIVAMDRLSEESFVNARDRGLYNFLDDFKQSKLKELGLENPLEKQMREEAAYRQKLEQEAAEANARAEEKRLAEIERLRQKNEKRAKREAERREAEEVRQKLEISESRVVSLTTQLEEAQKAAIIDEIEEKEILLGAGEGIDFSQLTISTLPLHAKESQASFLDYLGGLKDGKNDTIINAAKDAFNHVPSSAIFVKIAASLKYLNVAQHATGVLQDQLAKTKEQLREHKESEKEIRQKLELSESRVVSLTTQLQEAQDIAIVEEVENNKIMLGDKEGIGLSKITPQSLLKDSPGSLNNPDSFFDYLDTLKNGSNASIVEGTKKAYLTETKPHPYKLKAALEYLNLAQHVASATGALQDQLAITKEQLRDHRDTEEEIRQKLTIAESRVVSLTTQLEEAQSTAIVEGVEESKVMLDDREEIDFSQLTIPTLPGHAKNTKDFFFQYLDTLKNSKNDSLIDAAKQEYLNEPRSPHFIKMLAALQYLKAAQHATGALQDQLAITKEQLRDHRDAEEVIRQKLVISESRVVSLTTQLQEAQDLAIVEEVENNKIMLSAREWIDIAQYSVVSLPPHAIGSEAVFFQYLDTLKNGNNDSLIEEAKNVYTSTGHCHPLKRKLAITYLKVAQHLASVTGALQDQLAKTKEQLREHRDIEKKEILLGAIEEKEIDFSQLTLLTYAKESQISLFDYLDSLKNGKNDLIIQGAKDAYTKDTRAHIYKLGRAIDYLMAAQEVAGILQAQMAASQKK